MSADVPSKEAVDAVEEVMNNWCSTREKDALIIDAHFAPLRARIAELESQLKEAQESVTGLRGLELMNDIIIRDQREKLTTLRTAAHQAAKALEYELTENLKLGKGSNLYDFEGYAVSSHRRITAILAALRAAGVTGDTPETPEA